MIGGLIAWILLRTLCLSQTTEVPLLNALTVAEVGDNVTLHCNISSLGFGRFYWLKHSLGYMAQTVATGPYGKVKLSGQFNYSRFTFRVDGAQYFLTITNVSKVDEATYFCEGPAYAMIFYNSTFLAVNDYDQQNSVDVKQDPETKSVQLGDQVTLRCSLHFKNQEKRAKCSGGHRVSWFRSGNSYPALVNTHWNSSAACVESPSSQRSCVYTLSKHIRSSSDAGTYYCAVATCGEILFGDGTRVETRSKLDPVTLALGILLVCCVIVISVLCYFVKRGRICEHCKGATSASVHLTHGKSAVDLSSAAVAEEEAPNYAALNFSARQVQKGRRKRESQQESVYSDVRTHPTTPHRPLV
ncbi:uncharacterized protein LOC142999428 [Genypterus blacodes]|uniref:uncharacterized protein LOC142999428 n=1 Tax=Genypterus blacodes TaxID=154954 RepID=UPI003F770CB0